MCVQWIFANILIWLANMTGDLFLFDFTNDKSASLVTANTHSQIKFRFRQAILISINTQMHKYKNTNTQICKYTQLDQVSRRPFSSVISLNLRRSILLIRYICNHPNILYWQNGSFKFMQLNSNTNSCRKYVNVILLQRFITLRQSVMSWVSFKLIIWVIQIYVIVKIEF